MGWSRPVRRPALPWKRVGGLERRDADGQWSLVWDRPLVNEVGPVSALVSDAGDYVVTFDNWHSVGLGDNVVVLYDARGMVIRSLALTDIVPETYAAALPRSVSSLWWAGDHRIEGGRLILQLRRPSSEPAEDEPRYVEASIDLSSGRVLPLDGPDWRAALEEAGRVRAQQAEAEAIAVTRRRAPLTGPANGDEAAWHAYLREAFYRLDPDGSETHPLVEVLRRPDAGDYDASVAWLAEALNEDHGVDDRIMLGSPSQENLTRVLAHLLEGRRDERLRGATVYVAVGDEHWPAVERAFAPMGARLIQVDPSRPIPQRPERMPE